MATVLPTISTPRAIVIALDNIQPGQSIIYHMGVTLVTCPDQIRSYVRFLHENNRIRLFQRRRERPHGGKDNHVDWDNGIGTFEYIAVGRGKKVVK